MGNNAHRNGYFDARYPDQKCWGWKFSRYANARLRLHSIFRDLDGHVVRLGNHGAISSSHVLVKRLATLQV